ncbi:Pro-Pol polyprotein like [Argiope bruennichi]|uniref:Pro-Pol polyprotein like n=1 Tax=Argiope bruennichi TaxID=94029 RepID=A0A8T0F3G0_ARGBR|nr:Pro-Pol polyprotein like [Argiope bruennichi]
MGQPPVILHCNVSDERNRLFVPEYFRREIFNTLYSLSQPRVRASQKLVAERYVCPSMRQDVTLWTRSCLKCQRAKVFRNTRSKVGNFIPASSPFEHMHIDIVGPLPPSEGFRYRLTCVDRYSKWKEAFPLVEMSPETVAELSILDGSPERHRIAPYHPGANGQVERFHRQLKAAITAVPKNFINGNARWTIVLPTILLGFRAA